MGAEGVRNWPGSGRNRPTQHPVHIVHRVGAALLGLGLWVFAALGFVRGLAFLTTQGHIVLGLSSNGLLSTISAVAGTLLLAAAAWRGPVASSATAVLGGTFLLSGLIHFAVLGTPLNILAFRLPNVFFSLIAGMLLLFLGLYGRLAGGLPSDNPYRQARDERRGIPRQRQPSSEDDSTATAYVAAELAMAEGHPTARQQALVKQEQRHQQIAERERIRQRVHDEPSQQRETPERAGARSSGVHNGLESRQSRSRP